MPCGRLKISTFISMQNSRIANFSLNFSRAALAIAYIWFGVLKFFGDSSANELIRALLGMTMPAIPFGIFIIFLGAAEVLIGILFIIPKMEKVAVSILVLHMLTTFAPLILLPAITWQGVLTPTLEGQYIIKNIVIIALAISILAQIQTIRK